MTQPTAEEVVEHLKHLDARTGYDREVIGRSVTLIETLQAERVQLHEAFEPISDWYGVGEGDRSLVEALTDAVADLQHDRQDNLKMASALRTIRDRCDEPQGGNIAKLHKLVGVWIPQICEQALEPPTPKGGDDDE